MNYRKINFIFRLNIWKLELLFPHNGIFLQFIVKKNLHNFINVHITNYIYFFSIVFSLCNKMLQSSNYTVVDLLQIGKHRTPTQTGSLVSGLVFFLLIPMKMNYNKWSQSHFCLELWVRNQTDLRLFPMSLFLGLWLIHLWCYLKHLWQCCAIDRNTI